MSFAVIAAVLLFALVAALPVIGGVLFALVLLGAFLLALVGVLGQLQDRTVRQRDVTLEPTAWRTGGETAARHG